MKTQLKEATQKIFDVQKQEIDSQIQLILLGNENDEIKIKTIQQLKVSMNLFQKNKDELVRMIENVKEDQQRELLKGLISIQDQRKQQFYQEIEQVNNSNDFVDVKSKKVEKLLKRFKYENKIYEEEVNILKKQIQKSEYQKMSDQKKLEYQKEQYQNQFQKLLKLQNEFNENFIEENDKIIQKEKLVKKQAQLLQKQQKIQDKINILEKKIEKDVEHQKKLDQMQKVMKTQRVMKQFSPLIVNVTRSAIKNKQNFEKYQIKLKKLNEHQIYMINTIKKYKQDLKKFQEDVSKNPFSLVDENQEENIDYEQIPPSEKILRQQKLYKEKLDEKLNIHDSQMNMLRQQKKLIEKEVKDAEKGIDIKQISEDQMCSLDDLLQNIKKLNKLLDNSQNAKQIQKPQLSRNLDILNQIEEQSEVSQTTNYANMSEIYSPYKNRKVSFLDQRKKSNLYNDDLDYLDDGSSNDSQVNLLQQMDEILSNSTDSDHLEQSLKIKQLIKQERQEQFKTTEQIQGEIELQKIQKKVEKKQAEFLIIQKALKNIGFNRDFQLSTHLKEDDWKDIKNFEQMLIQNIQKAKLSLFGYVDKNQQNNQHEDRKFMKKLKLRFKVLLGKYLMDNFKRYKQSCQNQNDEDVEFLQIKSLNRKTKDKDIFSNSFMKMKTINFNEIYHFPISNDEKSIQQFAQHSIYPKPESLSETKNRLLQTVSPVFTKSDKKNDRSLNMFIFQQNYKNCKSLSPVRDTINQKQHSTIYDKSEKIKEQSSQEQHVYYTNQFYHQVPAVFQKKSKLPQITPIIFFSDEEKSHEKKQITLKRFKLPQIKHEIKRTFDEFCLIPQSLESKIIRVYQIKINYILIFLLLFFVFLNYVNDFY